jgi:pyridoxine 4-dehydrogenase
MTPSNPSMRTLPFSSLVAILLAFPEQSSAYVTDVTKVGSLTVPNVGIGTIAWSSNSLTKLENTDLDALVESACQQNGGFFDTGERYGSHIKTAMGMGWGETESMIAKMLQNADVQDDALRPTVATKFTPSPWRTSAKSVVEACEASRERLGVDSIDLYQIHSG